MINRKQSTTLKYAGLVIGVYALYRFVRGGVQLGSNVVSAIKNDVQAAEIKTTLQNNGIDNVREQTVMSVAGDIYNALYKDSWFGYGEDEQKTIDAFNRMQSINEAKACAVVYTSLYAKNLKSDLKKYLSSSDLGKLKAFLYAAIK